MANLLRSPPTMAAPIQHALSDTDVSKPRSSEYTESPINQRHKRRRDCDDANDSFSVFKEEIKDMLEKWNINHTSILTKLASEVAEIKTQNNILQESNQEIKDSIIFLSNEYDDIKKKLSTVELERQKYTKQIETLESKIEALERTQKITSIEIRNLPIMKVEAKADVPNIVIKTCKALNIDLVKQDIRDTYHFKGKSGNTTIVANLATVTMKNQVINAAKGLNKEYPKQRLDSTFIGLDDKSVPIYISEALTNKGRRLFSLTRGVATSYGFKYCWTNNGKIFLRKTDGAPHIEIKCETQLEELKQHQ